MYEWYIKKLNEFIQVVCYCCYLVIEVYLVFIYFVIYEYFGSGDLQFKKVLDYVIWLSVEQVMCEGLDVMVE